MATKMTIVWRNDLQCRTGKKMGQAGHAVLERYCSTFDAHIDEDGNVSPFKIPPAMLKWRKEQYRKIVLQVNSEEELLTIFNRAKELGLPVELITDCGLTEWDTPTKTCLAIGPEEEEKIDAVTGINGPLGRLKLM
jgi:peptidyl-tRNA hydrolase, PTH2 family